MSHNSMRVLTREFDWSSQKKMAAKVAEAHFRGNQAIFSLLTTFDYISDEDLLLKYWIS